MLYLTQVYVKISAYRKNTMLLEYASENGVKQGYDHLLGMLLSAASPVLLTDEEWSQILLDSQSGGNAAVRRILGEDLPIILEGSWERLGWESLMDFRLSHFHEEQEYFRVDYLGRIASSGSLRGFEPVKASFLDTSMAMLAGHIPLPAMALLVDKSMTPEEKSDFLDKNDIHMLPSEQIDLPPPLSFSDGGLLPEDAAQQLAKALKIEIFHPQDLSAADLRVALGLEVTDEPVPDGVYLIQDDLGLGGVFVQGDLDEMVLAIRDEYQIISFRQGEDLWILRFSPEESRTIFMSPAETRSFDSTPLGIIIVDGKILSLGGGYEDVDGRILLVEQKEIPCVKKGVQLTIISSDEIILSSHLIYEGVTWKEGVPYVKDEDSQLIIHAAGHDFMGEEERAGEIIIDESAPDDLKIHASLSASGNGFTVAGEDKKVQLLGSLQASDLSLDGNELSVKFDERFFHEGDGFFQNALLTDQPVLYLFSFKLTEWGDRL